MKEFLRQVAERYYAADGDDVCEDCFVFPNRRSALFFRKYLGQTAGKPVFSPSLLTINDLFAALSGLRPIGKIAALDKLYRHYAALMWPGSEPRESFDEFVFWGDTLLNDFDDIDKYRADARLLFANIKDINEIDAGYEFLSDEQKQAIIQFWGNFLANPKNAGIAAGGFDKKELFAKTWSILYPLYTSFRAELQAEGVAYEGMVYRYVADVLSSDDAGAKNEMLSRLPGGGSVVFVGLNALNECEKVLLDTLSKERTADFYWDFSGRMVRNEENLSSRFMTENVRRYPSRYELDEALPERQSFRSIAVPSGVGQTRVVKELLEKIYSEQGFLAEETAVVLPDENLLMPMLGAVPECVGDINVTMGFPLSASNVATFISMIEKLHRNKRVRDSVCGFYHRDVTNLLDHPFVRSYLASSEVESDHALAGKVIGEIRARNMIFVPASDIAAMSSLFAAIFKDVPSAAELSGYLVEILSLVQEHLSDIDREFVFNMETSIRSLANLGLTVQLPTYFRLLMQIADVVAIHFSGEPLSGLQIMGPLETRALDFKNMIVLSVNEGTFPKRSVSASFIPYNLRKGFGLPNYEFQDAISAYHFYRSICRAENIILLHDSRTEGMQSGEESRFIKQLKYHFNVPVTEETASYSLCGNKEDTACQGVEKTPEVLKRMAELFNGGKGRFSATSLNTYLNCRLKFYYSNVLGLSEEDEVSEELDAGMFGSVFHKVMESIYRPMKNSVVDKAWIETVRSDRDAVGAMIDSAFASECNIHEVSGRNLIVKSLLLRFVDQVLKVDAARAPFTVDGAESGMDFSMDIPAAGFPVKVYGKIDRMDTDSDGYCHIIDYKTGTVGKKAQFNEVGDMFDRSSDHRPAIAFQLYLYALLALNGDAGANTGHIIPTVYALREIFGGQPVERLVETEELEEFVKLLADLIGEIFDPQVPFSPDETGNSCEYCDFRKLCDK